MKMLAIVCLAIVWACFLVPPLLRRQRDGRPGSSVDSFRRQLSTLDRATPGTSLRPLDDGRPVRRAPVARSAASFASAPVARADVARRRREILIGLLGSTSFLFLLTVTLGGTLATLLFLASGAALGAYIYALVQLRQRAEEASAKVRVLHPQANPVRSVRSVNGPQMAVRRAASNS